MRVGGGGAADWAHPLRQRCEGPARSAVWYPSGVIKAVTFDFWNTLFVDRNGAQREGLRVEALAAELLDQGIRVDEARLTEGVAHGFDYFDRVWHDEHRTPDTAEILDAQLVELGVTLPAEARERVVARFADLVLELPPDPVDDAARIVAELGAGYQLAVICDTGYSPGSTLRELLRRHGMLDWFEVTYFSNEGGTSKPDPQVFRSVLERLDVRPAEAVHVGDMQRTDIAGAHGAGMWAIHFVGANDHDAQRSTADALISSLDELPEAVGNLTCPGCGLPRKRIIPP